MTTQPRGRARRSSSLRRYLAILLGVFGLLVAALLVVATLQVRGSDRQARAENRRTNSFLLADSLRQSSNDLTNMARLYVATGLPRYRDNYREILAIRAGTAPRPLNYGSSFWDRVLAEGRGFVRPGPTRSFIDQLRDARFAPDEFQALEEALATSNGLAELEGEVMAQVAAAGPGGVTPLYKRLVDRDYLRQKGAIMSAIQRFIGLVEARTLRDVRAAQAHNRDLLKIEVGIIAAIVLVGVGALLVLSRVALRPLGRLIASTRRIADGDYGERVRLRAVSELEDVAGAFNEMAGAVQADVAARGRAEREAVDARGVAEHASRAKTTFLAAMSHEIRTPMIGVTGMLEVLARTDLTPQQRQMLATAEGSAASLLQIIGDILDFSKIEADRLELAPTTIALPTVVHVAVDTFVHTASAKGLLLTWSVDDALAPAHVGDPLRLRQILSNLVSNAIKFTEVGGIAVAARALEDSGERFGRADAQTVEISVTDTGIGIEPEQQARLFREFTQADAATSRHFGGTGLGLVICRRLAMLMGGDITLESVPGRGTTVRLTVPLPVGDPADVGEDDLGPAVPAVSRPKPDRDQALREGSLLLLAEDHPVNRTVIGHQLDLVGFQVDMAVDGQEALERWCAQPYALVLTDLNMPRMDGYELAQRIRARERDTGAPRTPIIALSANVMQGEPERCIAAGMDAFIAKPTTIPVLAGRLRAWLPHLDWPREAPPAPARAGAGAEEVGVLDPAVLEELTGGDPELTAGLVADFVEACQADLAALRGALERREADAARREAHRMKGAARMVGAHEVARLTEQIEVATGGEITAWDRVLVDAEALSDCLDRVRVPG